MLHLSPDVWYFAARYALLLFAFVTLGYAFAYWRRAARRDTQRLFEQLDLAVGQLHRLAQALQAQETRVDGQFLELAQALQEQSRSTASGGTHTHRLYETAIRLARTGASGEELIANCGVSRHEAELLIRLHGPRSAAAAGAAATDEEARHLAVVV